jgi:multidrug efflux pump
MVLSDVSIKRPVFATVISLMLVVLGFAAYMKLPVREYPQIDRPIVSVVTVYKGASNEVVESRITEAVERAISGIEGVTRITSTSREERSQVVIEFRLARNIDAAAADVRDRIGRILARLPDGADLPIINKVDSDAFPILWFSLNSDTMNQMQLTDYARRNLVDRLAIVPGVAGVNVGGERRYSMRIWLDRQALAARNLTADDVENAIKRQNVELPGGRLESTSREFTVKTDSRLKTPEEFSAIVVAIRGGYPIRMGEVAKVEVAPEDERSEMRATGRTSIGFGIVRQSTANTLDVADGVKAELISLAPSFPEGLRYTIIYDEALFIRQSQYEVYHAFGIGMLLVIGVIFIFLRSVRATMIPSIAIPVSIIASFTVMAALGFSINVLTLLAYVLAIGIVVDDAIVVLENIHRRIELGEPPLLASLLGARQIAFAVIATTLTLVAVFVPLSFMEGNTGRLFTEFGIALASAVVFSGVIALTLTPMLCSKLLSHHDGEGWLVRVTERVFQGMNRGYHVILSRSLNAPLLVLALGFVAPIFLMHALFVSLPKEFAPVEDRGAIFVQVTAPEGASLDYTREHVARVEEILRPYIDQGQAMAIMANIAPGFQRPAPVNTANVSLRLKPWDERSKKQQQIHREIFPKVLAIPGVRANAVNPGSLGLRGIRTPIEYVIGGTEYETLRDWRNRMLERMRQDGRFINPDSNHRENKPEIRVGIDRLRAADLGVPVETIARTLETMFGSREVTQYVDRGEEYRVLLQARAEDRSRPHDLTNIFVRSATTQQLIPLSNLVSFREAAGPQDLTRVDRLRSITLTATPAPGFTLAEALDVIDQYAKELLPPEVRISYEGQSREFKESSKSLYVTFGLALLVVFLVLAAQFESWIHPLIIMLAVPLAITGGLLALWLTGISLNVYSQIGMILLVGLMAKNGILIVEFANQLRDEGMSVHDAVLEASVIRLRPILMTSIATVCGAVPLAVAAGAGAESREAIGWVIIGGVSLSTVMTLVVIPCLYLLLAHFTKPINTIAKKLSEMQEAQRSSPAAASPAE